MDAVIVRYELDPNRFDEHCKLIEAVFAHLRDERPEGVHYGVLKSADGTQSRTSGSTSPTRPEWRPARTTPSERSPPTSEYDASCRPTP